MPKPKPKKNPASDANYSIACTVENCVYNCENNFCSLDKIKIVNATNVYSNLNDCTDCGSFKPKVEPVDF